jgi:penicillin-binding protein 2
MKADREEHASRRFVILRVSFIALFVIYSIRLFSMQIFSGDFYRLRARNIARQTSIIPAQRGEIYDRNYNQPLVLNTESFAVSIIPAEVPALQMQEILARLASILALPLDQLERKVPRSIYFRYQPVEIAVSVSFSTISVISEQADSLPGVFWQSNPCGIIRIQAALPI